ncbi:hypothetical protein GX51_04381 [Blastomyces parvus]|uniref:Uncharacterized protein n=1 Tax=Blastomyces parvus TaxID=2060905 RepID=A0A2B7X1X3_9EURO|nr:hypothetical protein GX51_04381 [Blastomyces parvus]
MAQKRRSRRLSTHRAGPKTVIGTKRAADSGPHDSETPSKFLRITRSISSRYVVQHTSECGSANDLAGRVEEWRELVDESEWEEYQNVNVTPLTSEERELGNRAMTRLDALAETEWRKSARRIRTRRTAPDDEGGGPSGSRRQRQEPPAPQAGQSSVAQHDSSRQDTDSMPGNPGGLSQNRQPGLEDSRVTPSRDELRSTRSPEKVLRMRIRTWAGENPLSKRCPRPKLSAKFTSFPSLTRPGRRKETLFLEEMEYEAQGATASSRRLAPTRVSARLRDVKVEPRSDGKNDGLWQSMPAADEAAPEAATRKCANTKRAPGSFLGGP